MPKRKNVFSEGPFRWRSNRRSPSLAPPAQTQSGPSAGPSGSGDVPGMLVDAPEHLGVRRLGLGHDVWRSDLAYSIIERLFLDTFVPHSAIRTVGN